MSRLTIVTKNKAQETVEELYKIWNDGLWPVSRDCVRWN